MTQELSLIPENTGVAKYATEKHLSRVSSNSSYLPYIQLYGGSSNDCKEGKIGIGCWGVTVGKELKDLGKSFNSLLIGWRPKAMRFKPSILSIFNPANPEFEKIEKESAGKDSGCGFGPEYLLWLPDLGILATYFASNKTARNEAPNINAFVGKLMTLKSKLIKTDKYTWHGPEVESFNGQISLPDWDEIRPLIDLFNNPPESKVETVTGADSGRD